MVKLPNGTIIRIKDLASIERDALNSSDNSLLHRKKYIFSNQLAKIVKFNYVTNGVPRYLIDIDNSEFNWSPFMFDILPKYELMDKFKGL